MSTTKIYTRGGDAGETAMLSGERVKKSDPHIAAVGELDELSVSIGFSRLAHPKRNDLLKAIQKNLYQLSALVSYNGDKEIEQFKLEDGAIETLETVIDDIQQTLPPLKDFIYPGQSHASCWLHHARVVARRAERVLTMLPIEKGNAAIPYINRLSDLFFVLAREADQNAGAREEKYSD